MGDVGDQAGGVEVTLGASHVSREDAEEFLEALGGGDEFVVVVDGACSERVEFAGIGVQSPVTHPSTLGICGLSSVAVDSGGQESQRVLTNLSSGFSARPT